MSMGWEIGVVRLEACEGGAGWTRMGTAGKMDDLISFEAGWSLNERSAYLTNRIPTTNPSELSPSGSVCTPGPSYTTG